MSLLRSLFDAGPDEGYAQAAREGSGNAPGRPTAMPVRALVLGMVVPGLLLATAAGQARAREASAEDLRAALSERIARRTEAADQRSRDNERLRVDLAQARSGALARTAGEVGAAGPAGSAAAQLAGRLAALELAAGTATVQGPGVVLTLDDAPSANAGDAADAADAAASDPRADRTSGGRVLDRDLQVLTNGLWAAGAEAVSVDEQRLASGTAIRAAGAAILVGYRPLVPPYEVRAVGDPVRLAAALRDGGVGRELRLLAARHGVRSSVRTEEQLRLPGAAVPPYRSLRPGAAGPPW